MADVPETIPLIDRTGVLFIFIAATVLGFFVASRGAPTLALSMGFVAGCAATRWKDMR